MVEKVRKQDEIYNTSKESQKKHHAEIKTQKSQRNWEKIEEIKSIINEKIARRALEANNEVGTSSWLITLLIKKPGFCQDKQSFWDSLYMRYNTPLKCVLSFYVCEAAFKLAHALSCLKGEFMSIRH